MSEEQLNAFLEKVKADISLQEKLKVAADSDAVLAIAKEAGFSVSADDFKNAQLEISEEELEGVAGGAATNWEPANTHCSGWCDCRKYTNDYVACYGKP